MKPKDWFIFILLGAIWSASFLWIKIAVSEIGPFALVAFRVTFGALTGILITLFARTKWPRDRATWLTFGLLGVTSVAIPFVPTDGYFLLTTILKIPNLRSDAFEVIRSAVSGGNIRIRLSVVAYLIVSLTIIIKFIIMQGYWLARMMRELLFSRPTHLTFEYILKAGVVLLIVISIVNVVSRQFKRFRRRKLSST